MEKKHSKTQQKMEKKIEKTWAKRRKAQKIIVGLENHGKKVRKILEKRKENYPEVAGKRQKFPILNNCHHCIIL